MHETESRVAHHHITTTMADDDFAAAHDDNLVPEVQDPSPPSPPQNTDNNTSANSSSKHSAVQTITAEMIDLAAKGKKEIVTKNNMVWATEPVDLLQHGVFNDVTRKEYSMYLDMFEKFLILIGDYESLLMLDPLCPANCMSVKPESAMLFIRYKTGCPADGNLLNESVKGHPPVMDVVGNNVQHHGMWRNPGNLDHFRSALSHLHRSAKRREQYQEACQQCLQQTGDDKWKGCSLHPGKPRLLRQGNTVEDPDFSDWYKRVHKQVTLGHISRGNAQLYPSEVRRICEYCLASNDITGLQLVVLILMGIKMYLRSKELLDLSDKNVVEELFLVKKNGVCALAFKVNGKSDQEWIHMYLRVDKSHPHFCPVWHLLVYLDAIGWKGGFLFPNAAELKDPPKDGIFKTQMQYPTLHLKFKNLFYGAPLKRDSERSRLGCHSLRKTGYLFAIFGGGNVLHIMKEARHKTHSVALTYVQDAEMKLHSIEECDIMNESVSSFRPTVMGNKGDMSTIGRNLSSFNKPLPNLASDFVNGLSVPPGISKTIKDIVEAAHNWHRPDTSIEGLMGIMSSHGCGDAVKASICEFMTRAIDEAIETERKKWTKQGKSADTDIGTVTVHFNTDTNNESGETKASGKRKKRGGGEEDLEVRHGLKKAKTTEARIGILRDMLAAIEEKNISVDFDLTSGARTATRKHAMPCVACLRNHFGNDINKFAMAFPLFRHTTHGCKGVEGEACTGMTKKTNHKKEEED